MICYFFPKSYNDYFWKKYHEDVISWAFAITSVVLLVISILFGSNGGWVFGILFSLFIICIVLSLFYCFIKGKNVNASIVDIIVSMVAQLLATFGIVVLVIIVIAALNKFDKRRRNK